MKKPNGSSAKALRPDARVVPQTRDSFANFEAKIGYGTGNLSDGGDYRVNYLSRNRWRLESMYRSSWICGKAVDSIAEDMTKRGIDINSEFEAGEIDELMALWKQMKIWDRLSDTIKWARLYGGAIAVLLIDGQDFSTPLRIETVKKDQFKGLLVLDRWLVQPTLDQLVTEMGPEMGLPKFYDVIADSLAIPRARIHHSRVLRIEGQELPYWQKISENLWGQSVLERLFDRLLAFDSTTQGAAQLVYKAHLRTYKIKGLREIIALGGPALEGLTKQIDFLRHAQTNEGLTLMDAEDEFEAHSYAFGGLDMVLLQMGQQISGALNIPLVRLFGQSPAGLNSTGESDIRTYYDGIEQEQEHRLRAGVHKLLHISYQSLSGKPLPDRTDFTFRPLWQLTDEQKAQIASTTTASMTQAVSGGIAGRQTALRELRASSRITGIWSSITDEEIEGADNDVNPGEMGAGDPFGDEDEDDSKRKTLVSAS